MDSRVFVAIGLTILPWASAFAGIRAGLQDYTPAHLTLLRFLVASGVMLMYALLVRMPLPERRDWPSLFGLGFLGITVYHTALNFGQVTVKAGPAALLIAVGPVFVALMSYFFLREQLSGWGWLGIGVAFSGVALIALGNHPDGFELEPGALLILLAAFVTSVYFVFQRRLARKYSPLHFTRNPCFQPPLGEPVHLNASSTHETTEILDRYGKESCCGSARTTAGIVSCFLPVNAHKRSDTGLDASGCYSRSTAPMSQPFPWGRFTLRASLSTFRTLSGSVQCSAGTRSSAGLPGPGRWVATDPPLSARGARPAS